MLDLQATRDYGDRNGSLTRALSQTTRHADVTLYGHRGVIDRTCTCLYYLHRVAARLLCHRTPSGGRIGNRTLDAFYTQLISSECPRPCRASSVWYPRRESNPQIPASKASRYASSLTGAWYPHLDSNQEILLVLSELRMPFRHEGLWTYRQESNLHRTGLQPAA